MAETNAPVSVVMGAYNAARFIIESLDSIRAQSAAPLEIIVVDDASTDATGALAEAWGATVVRQPSRSGVAGSRNAGIARATGEFIAICDADDLWHPAKLERQCAALGRVPDVDFAFCDYYDFSSDGIINPSLFKAVHTHFERVERIPLGDAAYRCTRESLNAVTLHQTFALPSTFVVRRSLVNDLGGFDVDAPPQEDVEFLLRVFTRSDGVFIDAPLMGYRRHDNNVSGDPRKLRYGMIKHADRVIAHSERYRPESARHFSTAYPELLFKAGRMYASYGEADRARDLLLSSLAKRRSAATLLWLGLTPILRARIARELLQALKALVASRPPRK